MTYRIILSLIIVMLGFGTACAQSAAQVVNKVLEGYNRSHGISATFNVANSQGTSTGTIDMMGQKYRILSNDMNCWFDGKTQ